MRPMLERDCVFCHGVPGVDRSGNIPDLGEQAVIGNLDKFMDGALKNNGRPDGKVTGDDVDKLKAFIQGTADAIRPR